MNEQITLSGRHGASFGCNIDSLSSVGLKTISLIPSKLGGTIPGMVNASSLTRTARAAVVYRAVLLW